MKTEFVVEIDSWSWNLQIQQSVQAILLWRHGKESIDSRLYSVLKNYTDFIRHQEREKLTFYLPVSKDNLCIPLLGYN